MGLGRGVCGVGGEGKKEMGEDSASPFIPRKDKQGHTFGCYINPPPRFLLIYSLANVFAKMNGRIHLRNEFTHLTLVSFPTHHFQITHTTQTASWRSQPMATRPRRASTQ